MCATDSNERILSEHDPLEGGTVRWSRDIMGYEKNAA
jgi:hypothetical protein